MKKINLLVIAAIALLGACTPKGSSTINVSATEYSDSTDMLYYSIHAELPDGQKGIAGAIGDTLACLLEKDMQAIYSFDGATLFEAYKGDKSDREAYLKYVTDAAFSALKAHTEKEKAEALEDDPFAMLNPWGCYANLSKTDETDGYVVFHLSEDVYYGGAHGGVVGAGALTFSKKTGKRVIDMVDASKVIEMQPILIAGVASYMNEMGDASMDEDEVREWLFIEDGIIPLPVMTPYPTAEGLAFVYAQYEIAPYAAGMPSFTVPYDRIREFMTPEALELID